MSCLIGDRVNRNFAQSSIRPLNSERFSIKIMENLKRILDDSELVELQRFIQNERLVEAVKKVLLAGVYSSGVLKKGEKAEPTRNFALTLASQPGATDAQIANQLRADAEAIRMLEQQFKEMQKIQFEVIREDKKNPAR